jgi:hypothetical protein
MDATAPETITSTQIFLQAEPGVNYIFSNADGNTISLNASLTAIISLREPATLTLFASATTSAGTYQVIGTAVSSQVYFTRLAKTDFLATLLYIHLYNDEN